MCKALNIPRSTYYYKEIPRPIDTELENAVIEEFRKSRNNYGVRKLRVVLRRRGFTISTRRVGKIMAKYNLVSNYTLRRARKRKATVNNDQIDNKVQRGFNDRERYEVVVSDLTYVKIVGKWHYICPLLDLHGRKIIGSAVGREKDGKLVETAFYSIQADLRRIKLFHTDRGGEFKNQIIEQLCEAFGIERSLSAKGTPLDNAVAESLFNIIKTEFVFQSEYADLAEFKLHWFDYVNWYNNVRIHGSLGYMTPNEWLMSSST